MTGTGLSGAGIEVIGNRVVKTGGDVARTVAQGQWLKDFGACDYLPVIHEVGPRGYVMEKLDPLTESEKSRHIVGGLSHILKTRIWTHRFGPTVKWDQQATERKMLDIFSRVDAPSEVTGPVLERFDKWHPMDPATTHGDPTYENLMMRPDPMGGFWTMVLIDPIPPTPEVPDVRGVDVGKILQSALGWERAKGEDPCPWSVSDVKSAFEERDYQSGTDWVTVHLARTLPYITTHRPELREWVFNAIRQAVDL
jgi:hypothetical protein